MIIQRQLTEIFSLWNKLSYSKLLSIVQNSEFQIEFAIDEALPAARLFLSEIRNLTVNKHPSGSISFISYWSPDKALMTQYKRYRINFIDSLIKETIDENKLMLYVEKIRELVKGKVST